MSWNAKYVFLILLTTVISFVSGLLMEKLESKKARKRILVLAIIVCLGILFFFKYFDFAVTSVCQLLEMFAIRMNPVTLKLLLPVGISFYTFQTLSYVIDVYKGSIKAEHHFGYYATFVSFFPQLVAGPIERTDSLLPQIKEIHSFDYEQSSYGLKLMAWGFFKKIVVADTLSEYTSIVCNSPREYTGFTIVLAIIFFAIQIYCDFSGYSDIAIGTAKLFGIRLMTNFKSPYFSQSLKEFWSRWHISLSSWFRDYVYIPLGGNRTGKLRKACNLLITFLASGLWHGSNWTYVIWGGIHGLGQIVEDTILGKNSKKGSKGILWLIRVFLVFAFVSFAWIFFVSNSVSDALYVITNSFNGISSPFKYINQGRMEMGVDVVGFAYIAVSLLILMVYDFCSLKTDVIEYISSKNTAVRWMIYVAFIIWIIMNIAVDNNTEFIYFQF